MKAIAMEINQGQSSAYWILSIVREDGHFDVSQPFRCWKTRNGAENWAKKNGYELCKMYEI